MCSLKNGTAVAWLTSCLTNRTQTVRIGSVTSVPSIRLSGVPQGSFLGLILFSLYILPMGQIVSGFGISHQQHANDAKLYISLKSATTGTFISHLETLLSILHSWLCLNGLSLNSDKSEAVFLAHVQWLRTIPATPSIHISGTVFELSGQFTSLVVVMDSNLTFYAHITAVSNDCYFHLRSPLHIVV